MASIVRAAALRSRCLSLAKTCSFNGVQVWRVLRQKEQFGTSRTDEVPHGFSLMAAEIVHDDDVTFAQRRHEHPFDVGSKALAVDRPFKKPRRINPVEAQCSQKGCRLPAPMRDLSYQSLAARCPSAQRAHVGLGPGLVDEDQTLGVNAILILCPLRAPACHVGAVAFASHQAFFLKLSVSSW